MLYVVETSQYAPGKREEAMTFLKKAVAYYRKTAGIETHVVQRTAAALGQQAMITTIATVESLSAWDAFAQRRKKDPEWQALVLDIFVPEKGCWAHNSYTRSFFEEV
jgi:hypothetical protein